MINLSLKRTTWRFGEAFTTTVDSSYLKHFNQAVLNLELNMQEERIKRQAINKSKNPTD